MIALSPHPRRTVRVRVKAAPRGRGCTDSACRRPDLKASTAYVDHACRCPRCREWARWRSRHYSSPQYRPRRWKPDAARARVGCLRPDLARSTAYTHYWCRCPACRSWRWEEQVRRKIRKAATRAAKESPR